MDIKELKDNFSMFIYKTTNRITGKFYIGQKATPWNILNYKGSGKLLVEDIKKYGKKNFEVEVLECNISTRKELNEREKYWINFFDAKNSGMGYNMNDGGEGCSNPLPEVLFVMSEKQKGKITWMKGKKHKPESIQKIKDHHADISGEKNYWFGTHLTPEARQHMSENHANFKWDKNPSFHKKMSHASSKYFGVSFNRLNNNWQSYFNIEPSKRFSIGSFATETEAAMAYNETLLDYYGWKAKDWLNNIPQNEIDNIWNILLPKESVIL